MLILTSSGKLPWIVKKKKKKKKTFLDKAICDDEDSVYNYYNVRTEMDITTQMIAQAKQRLSTEILIVVKNIDVLHQY